MPRILSFVHPDLFRNLLTNRIQTRAQRCNQQRNQTTPVLGRNRLSPSGGACKSLKIACPLIHSCEPPRPSIPSHQIPLAEAKPERIAIQHCGARRCQWVRLCETAIKLELRSSTLPTPHPSGTRICTLSEPFFTGLGQET